MRDNAEGDELDPAEGVRWRCKKNSSFLAYIGKRIREGCDRGSEVWTVLRRTRRGRAAPTSRRLNVVMRSLPLLHEVGRNGETTFPSGPTTRSLPIVY